MQRGTASRPEYFLNDLQVSGNFVFGKDHVAIYAVCMMTEQIAARKGGIRINNGNGRGGGRCPIN